jgi:hypothetical protein
MDGGLDVVKEAKFGDVDVPAVSPRVIGAEDSAVEHQVFSWIRGLHFPVATPVLIPLPNTQTEIDVRTRGGYENTNRVSGVLAWGPQVEDAVELGAQTLFAVDSGMTWWERGAILTRVELAAAGNRAVVAVCEIQAAMDYDVALFALPDNHGRFCVLAYARSRSSEEVSPASAIEIASGSSVHQAASRAMSLLRRNLEESIREYPSDAYIGRQLYHGSEQAVGRRQHRALLAFELFATEVDAKIRYDLDDRKRKSTLNCDGQLTEESSEKFRFDELAIIARSPFDRRGGSGGMVNVVSCSGSYKYRNVLSASVAFDLPLARVDRRMNRSAVGGLWKLAHPFGALFGSASAMDQGSLSNRGVSK